jgi:hypothetical protein
MQLADESTASSGPYVALLHYRLMRALLLAAPPPPGDTSVLADRIATYWRAMSLFERETGVRDRRELDRCRGLLRSAGVCLRWGVPGAVHLCDEGAFGILRATYQRQPPQTQGQTQLAPAAAACA